MRLVLDRSEAEAVRRIAEATADRYHCADSSEFPGPEFLAEATLLAHDLPLRTREFLNRFRREESGYAVLSGHLIDDSALEPTPSHWNITSQSREAGMFETMLVLYSGLLGDLFGWASQQNGRLVHNVLPVRAHELEQIGTGSATELTWHTEDPYHDLRGDYLALGCLRNPDRAVTTVARIDDVVLDPTHVEVLFQKRFVIPPDESHMPEHNAGADPTEFADIVALRDAPVPVALLYGDVESPYIRADSYFWDVADPSDTAAADALRHLAEAIDARIQGVVLEPGDVLLVDNHKVVHGRQPFKARFDGTDRWLKRTNITRDLRKSRHLRATASSAVLR